jgi:hypothetical protein
MAAMPKSPTTTKTNKQKEQIKGGRSMLHCEFVKNIKVGNLYK